MRAINELLFSQIKPKDPSEAPKREMGKDDFLMLLVTELRNQNPLNVKEDKDFIAQLAQFSSLEQTTNLSNNLQGMLEFQQLTQGSTLIGKEVEAQLSTTTSTGENQVEIVKGTVTETRLADGEIKILVGDKLVSMKNVLKVK